MANPLRVLIVEDSEDDALLVDLELQRGGYESVFERVDCPEDFCRALENQSWDCIIADYSMPRFGGLEALRLFKESEQDIPFIVVSGTIGEDVAVATMKAGAHDYVMKDNLARLVPAVRRELREADTRRAQQRSRRLLEALNRAALAMEEALTPEEIFAAVADEFEQIGFSCILFFVDEERRNLLPRYLSYAEEIVEPVRRLLGVRRAEVKIPIRGLEPMESIVWDQQTVFVPDAMPIVQKVLPIDVREKANQVMDIVDVPKSINAPLVVDGEVVALLSVQSDDLLKDDVVAVTAFAHQMAAAWRKAQLLQQAQQEIAERRRAEEVLERRNRELTVLYEVGRDIVATLDWLTVLERIATYGRDLLRADESEVYVLGSDGQTLRAVVALGEWAEQYKAATFGLGEGLVGYVAERGEPEAVQNIADDPRVKRVPGAPVENSAVMCVPLIYKNSVLGVIALVRLEHSVKARGSFGSRDLDFAVALAQQAAVAIENARLFAAEQEYATQLARALEQQRDLAQRQSEFVQNVSHELRTPLALIRGYAELLESDELGQIPPQQREPLSVIVRRVRMLAKLVDNLTTILETEQQDSQRELVDAVELVRNVLMDFRVAVQDAGLTLSAHIEPDLPPVWGDSTHLRRVLDNLLGNALKFTPSGGSITVHLGMSDDRLALKVKDTGVGIPEDQAEHIFERFYQVDGSMSRTYGGAGLGLALVKQIVEAHGGTVDVESQEGQGSTFIVHLPVVSHGSEHEEAAGEV